MIPAFNLRFASWIYLVGSTLQKEKSLDEAVLPKISKEFRLSFCGSGRKIEPPTKTSSSNLPCGSSYSYFTIEGTVIGTKDIPSFLSTTLKVPREMWTKIPVTTQFVFPQKSVQNFSGSKPREVTSFSAISQVPTRHLSQQWKITCGNALIDLDYQVQSFSKFFRIRMFLRVLQNIS